MFGKIKKVLGIEGVKMELIAPNEAFESTQLITGKLKFTSLTNQNVKSISLKLIERYSRGRKDKKRIDEYEVGTIVLSESFDITSDQIIELDFELPFSISKSEMDMLEDNSFIGKGFVKLAKRLRSVKSDYRIEVEADVKGTSLNPTASSPIKIK